MDGHGDVDLDDTMYLFDTVPSDLNFDGKVDSTDIATFDSNFGSSGTYGDGDVNGDGSVTIADYNIIAGNYGWHRTP